MESYEEFVSRKLVRVPDTGMASIPALHSSLFPHQRDLTTWALRRGRCAVFADTGLGKSAIEIEYARHVSAYTNRPVLILTPLAVAQQMVQEGRRLGVDVKVCRERADIHSGVNVTNYDRLHKFDSSVFGGLVADESSILKSHESKTLQALIDAFRETQFKLAATATPSPNDYTELGTHAEFLGVCKRTEMLAEFFQHDGGETQTWVLKGHARQPFWRWVASWGALIRKPSDLGHSNDGYDLPSLREESHVLPADPETVKRAGLLFAEPAGDLMARRAARRASIDARVAECTAIVNSDDEQWIVWAALNDESRALAQSIRGAIEVTGSQDVDEKELRLQSFLTGESRILVTKSSIAGFGINAQRCARMAFVGVDDSHESRYQSIRRIWRFGQKRECVVHTFASEVEGNVLDNLSRKAKDAERMAQELSRETGAMVRAEVLGQERYTNDYAERRFRMPAWLRSEP